MNRLRPFSLFQWFFVANTLLFGITLGIVLEHKFDVINQVRFLLDGNVRPHPRMVFTDGLKIRNGRPDLWLGRPASARDSGRFWLLRDRNGDGKVDEEVFFSNWEFLYGWQDNDGDGLFEVEIDSAGNTTPIPKDSPDAVIRNHP